MMLGNAKLKSASAFIQSEARRRAWPLPVRRSNEALDKSRSAITLQFQVSWI